MESQTEECPTPRLRVLQWKENRSRQVLIALTQLQIGMFVFLPGWGCLRPVLKRVCFFLHSLNEPKCAHPACLRTDQYSEVICGISITLWVVCKEINHTEVSSSHFDTELSSFRALSHPQPYWNGPSFSATKLFSTGWSCVIEWWISSLAFFLQFVEIRRGDRRRADLISVGWLHTWTVVWEERNLTLDYVGIVWRFLTKL